MRHTFTIFRWEIKKILNNWRRTLVVFLLPAVIMLVALNVFPLLINYLSTGHLQSHPAVSFNCLEIILLSQCQRLESLAFAPAASAWKPE